MGTVFPQQRGFSICVHHTAAPPLWISALEAWRQECVWPRSRQIVVMLCLAATDSVQLNAQFIGRLLAATATKQWQSNGCTAQFSVWAVWQRCTELKHFEKFYQVDFFQGLHPEPFFTCLFLSFPSDPYSAHWRLRSHDLRAVQHQLLLPLWRALPTPEVRAFFCPHSDRLVCVFMSFFSFHVSLSMLSDFLGTILPTSVCLAASIAISLINLTSEGWSEDLSVVSWS